MEWKELARLVGCWRGMLFTSLSDLILVRKKEKLTATEFSRSARQRIEGGKKGQKEEHLVPDTTF